MALLIGASLAIAVGLFATFVGLDRDRAFYPTVMIVIASYYVLFAAMGATSHSVAVESLYGAVFVAAAMLGFKLSPWVVVAALASHGLFDLLHGHIVSNPGVPAFWPQFCLTYDVAAAAYLAFLILRRRIGSLASFNTSRE